jgi:hypothetical protein
MAISSEYQQLIRELHEREDSFGGGRHVHVVAQLMRKFNVGTLSDYGAGKMRLAEVLRKEFALQFDYFPYDPAFPEYGVATPADLVCCIEVLEHIEPDHIDAVLEELASITVKYGFFTVHCAESGKVLADGRNAHILQRPISWWLTKLSHNFEIQWLTKTGLNSLAVFLTRPDNPLLRLTDLDITQSDSIVKNTKLFGASLSFEIRRRLRRGHWRPK